MAARWPERKVAVPLTLTAPAPGPWEQLRGVCHTVSLWLRQGRLPAVLLPQQVPACPSPPSPGSRLRPCRFRPRPVLPRIPGWAAASPSHQHGDFLPSGQGRWRHFYQSRRAGGALASLLPHPRRREADRGTPTPRALSWVWRGSEQVGRGPLQTGQPLPRSGQWEASPSVYTRVCACASECVSL